MRNKDRIHASIPAGGNPGGGNPAGSNSGGGNEDARLDELFRAYREACPDPEPGVNFTPELWARIEARQVSSTLFGRMAKALVTAALAATAILGLIVSTRASRNETQFNGTYLEALRADRAATLEPLNLDRVSEMEQQ